MAQVLPPVMSQALSLARFRVMSQGLLPKYVVVALLNQLILETLCRYLFGLIPFETAGIVQIPVVALSLINVVCLIDVVISSDQPLLSEENEYDDGDDNEDENPD